MMRRQVSFILLTLLAFTGVLSAQEEQPVNVLSVPDFEARIDKTVNVPVYLSNTQEVVAAQFDVELPFNVPADGTPQLTNRANQHSVTINARGGNKFTVVVMSMKNAALRGNSGLLLRLPMSAYDDGRTATPYTIRLTNVVLTDRQGNNIATASQTTGHYTVSRESLPDLIVPSVTPVTMTAQPGGTFETTFQVRNDGQAATRAGWAEKFYFESATTGVRTYIGSQTYGDSLQAQKTVSRRFATVLPTLIHADGQQYVVVEIVPLATTGELTVDRGNNSERSTTAVTLGKKLVLTANKLTVSEAMLSYTYKYYGGSYSYRDCIVLTVSRSGDWSTDEQFPLTCSVDGLLSAGSALHTTTPYMVTIPAKAASATVTVYAVDDQIVRAREADLIIGEANGYNGASLHITRTEDDVNPLTLTASMTQMTEGKDRELVLTATRGGELTDELLLTVTCSESQRFTPHPIQLSLAKGQSAGSVTVTLTDDATAQLDTDARFTVRATDYQTASATVRLLDDDRPQITMVLHPSVVSENAGGQAATATIGRDRGSDQEMTVRLSSASEANVFFAEPTVTFTKGEWEKDVAVGIKDNTAVDGQRTCLLTAALYLPSNLTVAPVGDRARATATLTVTDDESPYLALSTPNAFVGEGSTFTVTVRRYVVSAGQALTVNLSADKAGDVKMPATVVIPAGSTTATFSIEVLRNEQKDDERPLCITATAAGLMSSQLSVRISDRTLPDAVCPSVGVETAQLYSNMDATFTATISNVGTAQLPKDVPVDFFLASSDRLYSYSRTIPVFTARTTVPVGIGESTTMTFRGKMPSVVGGYWLYARLNSGGSVTEFSTANNVSAVPAEVKIAAPFSLMEFKVEHDSYLPGQTVRATGRVTTKLPEGLRNQRVSITIEGTGQSRKTVTTEVNEATGLFEAFLGISSSAQGMLTLTARAEGQTVADLSASVNIWNLMLTADKTTWTLDENYPHKGRLTVRNTSGRTITGLAIDRSSLPYGCLLDQFQLSKTTLAAGEELKVDYNVTPTQSMSNGQYAAFTLTAHSNEGATAQLPISYYCRATTSKLTFESNPLNTTLLLNTSRTVQLKVTNCGLRASGPVDIVLPKLDWLACRTVSPMASIEPGKSGYITLELKHQPVMHSGQTFSANLTLNPENGASAGIRLNTTIVGTEYSKLNVDVTDVFVKARREYLHVSAAQVSITEWRSGNTVMTGITDGSGHWQTDRITQGTYYVTVSALRHKSVRQLVTIGPGDEQSMRFFLPYQAVLTDFVAEQSITDGSYTLVSTIDIDRDAPQAIVVPELPESGFECGTDTVQVTLRNEGTFAASNIQMVFPQIAGISFAVGSIAPINPGCEAVVDVVYQGPEEGRRRSIAKMLMHYDFVIAGETLSEDDYYQSLVGCASSAESPKPLIVIPDEPAPDGDDEDGGDGDDFYGGGGKNSAEPEGPSTSVALPTLNSSATLTFDDISRITTGTPFGATLRVVNGQSSALRNMSFRHTVSDDSDDYETDLSERFTCNTTDKEGFDTSGTTMTLNGHTEGTMHLEFVPQNEAAADGAHVYYLGGSLSYTDSQGLAMQVALPQIMITVSQLGRISITYLMQSDFLGDDETTEEEENAVPGHFIVLVRNEGKTPVNGLQITANEAVVLNNQTGEAQYPHTLSAQLDNQPTNDQLSAFSIDTLSADSMATAVWMLQSDADSHLAADSTFAASVQATANVELTVTVNSRRKLFRAVCDMDHNDGSPDMTDIDAVREQLSKTDVFLLDDIEDEDMLPDRVMLANSQEEPLAVVSETVSLTGHSGTYTLTVNADMAGWAYGRIADPTTGKMVLQRVEHNGKTMSAANFWQTDHTVLSDYSTLSEAQLHFADKMEAGTNTYTLYFVEMPGESVQGIRCRLFTADGNEVQAGTTTKRPVTKVLVDFTSGIYRLFKNYYSLTVDNKTLDISGTTISQVDDASLWSIDLSTVEAVPGQHRFQLDVTRLKDASRTRYGKGELSIEWNEELSLTAHITIEAAPDSLSGTISQKSGDYAYGPLQLTAQPAEGYEFSHWTVNGMRVDDAEATFTYQVEQDATVSAHFVLKTYEIKVAFDATMGYVNAPLTAFYNWHELIWLTAIPNTGYTFSHWSVENAEIKEQTIQVLVKSDCTYTAVFSKQEESGIASVSRPAGVNRNIYSVDGRLLRRNVTNVGEALRSLPAGLYVIDGRKVAKTR